MSVDPPSFLDGNAAAGELREVFAVDLTAAVGQCAGCGRVAVLAEARLYVHAPGLVARCPGCDGVLFRLVKAPGRTWLDLRGLAYLQIATPDEEDRPPPA
jgi:hypothetical protein